MRRIKKTHPPKKFLEWFEENKNLDCSYDALRGTTAHADLKRHLIKEQGFICAYTGLEIKEDNSHIEHIKPQNKCVGNEDVEYRNIVACFPLEGGDESFGYGAPIKRGWWEEKVFISPLSDECERRFVFSWSGKIKEYPENEPAAKKTIEILGLSNKKLSEIRKKAIFGFFGLGAKAKPLSKKDAVRLINFINEFDSSGRLKPFCFVFKYLLPKYVDGLNKN